MGTILDTRLYVLFLFTTFFVLNDARYPVQLSLPPFELLAPLPLPKNIPPYCVNYPPFAPQPPSTAVPTPPRSSPSPPSPSTPKFPIQSPPPSPPTCMPAPKPPPQYESTPPPCHGPSPPKHVPSPPFRQPPTVRRPPLSVPPPPHRKPQYAVWCVAKPTVPDAILQEALDYACGSGADCKSIQPNGLCFQPNTLLAHASYAFNSYWQDAKAGGGTCDFGGTAILVTADPSKYSSFVLGDFREGGSVDPDRSAVGRSKSGCIDGSYALF